MRKYRIQYINLGMKGRGIGTEVGLMINKGSFKSCLRWEATNIGIPVAYFATKKLKI